MSTVQMGLRVPSHLYEKLAESADKANTSKTVVVLAALAQYLNSREDVPLTVRVSELEAKVERLQRAITQPADVEE